MTLCPGHLLTVLLLALASGPFAVRVNAQGPLGASAQYRLQATFHSPVNDLAIDLLALSPGQDAPEDAPVYQAWVVERERRATNRRLLLTSDWPLKAWFSRDGYYVAIERGTGRETSDLLLYQRMQGMRFDQLPEPGPALWDYLANQVAGTPPAANGAVRFMGWSMDGSALLTELSSSGAGERANWFLSYDVRQQKPSFDLGIANKGWPQTHAPGRDLLSELEYPATERAHDRLLRAFAVLTQPSGGEETLPQPGDPMPRRRSDEERLARLRKTAPASSTPIPVAQPTPRKLRVNAAGDAILYSLYQPGAGKTPAREWFCIFDMNTGRPTLDLATMNRARTSNPLEQAEEEHGI